jgi:DNA invertase Pin-like site-specific DNA recombinase
MPDKYVAYYRVSTDKQEERKNKKERGLGLEAQEAIVKYFFPTVEREFTEIMSGKNMKDRPILKKAIEYCQKNDCTLVVAKVDRLARNVIDGLSIVEMLGNKIKFCDLPANVDKFTLTLYFAFAEREREMISIRIRDAFNRKRERGENMHFHYRPFTIEDSLKGAKVRKDTAMEQGESIRAYNYIVSLRKDNLRWDDIAKKLNESEFKTNTGKHFSKSAAWYLYKRHHQTK